MKTIHRLFEKYKKIVVPALAKQFGYKNLSEAPKLEKVVINIGLNQAKDQKLLEAEEKTMRRISGQKPVERKARKSISNFKIRKGQVIGLMVTLRGKRMYDFVDKLINLSLPRVRDFRGILEKSIDSGGNLSIGFKENIVFPEIRPDEVDRLHGLEVTVCTSANDKVEALALLRGLGFPFRGK